MATLRPKAILVLLQREQRTVERFIDEYYSRKGSLPTSWNALESVRRKAAILIKGRVAIKVRSLGNLHGVIDVGALGILGVVW